MQSRLLFALLLWTPMHNVTTAAADCIINPSLKCIEYIVNSKPCVDLSARGCNYSKVKDTTNLVWYRCDSVHSSSCQQKKLINITDGNGYFHLSPETGLLCFSNLNKTLTGIYCYKEMENSPCNPIQIVIVEKPAIKATMSNVTVVTGGVAEWQNIAILQCDISVRGCPPASVYWRYGSREEEEEPEKLSNNSHHTIITKHNVTKLIISDASVNDSDKYECVVNDMYYTKSYADVINLTVSRAVAQNITASLCSSQLLPCNHDADNPADYQWTHDGVNIPTTEPGRYHIAANGSLNLSAITSSDFGVYSCRSIPTQYGGSFVTQLLLVQQIVTAVPLISEYAFLLIHPHNLDSQLAINEISSSLQMHINKFCGDCCDVTIVMCSLWACPCSNTIVFIFKLSGSLAITAHGLLNNYFTANQTVGSDNFTFSLCIHGCCELCDNSVLYDGSDDKDSETDLAVTITMATLIVVLLILEVIILISYHWYSRRLQIKADPTVGCHGDIRHEHSSEEGQYDKLNHNHNINTTRTHMSYESIP